MLSLLFLHLILIVLNRIDVKFRLPMLIYTLFWVPIILASDAGENIGVVLVQIFL